MLGFLGKLRGELSVKSFSGFKKGIKNYICNELKDRIDFRFSVLGGTNLKTIIKLSPREIWLKALGLDDRK